MKNKIVSSVLLFLFGAAAYSLIEILWRGYTHWTMFVLGGVCFLVICALARYCRGRLPLWFCCFAGMAAITTLEFVTGCIFNLALGWNVWDYSAQPLDLLGQVCLGYSSLWFLLCIPATGIALWMGERFSGT